MHSINIKCRGAHGLSSCKLDTLVLLSEKPPLQRRSLKRWECHRGFNVDVGVVEKYVANQSGSYSKKNYEVDFVANKGSERLYIQSAYFIDEESKKEQEERSLREIDDSFKKIIVTYDSAKPYYNANGFLIIGLIDFLLDENSLRF